jgi:hypothetical protein
MYYSEQTCKNQSSDIHFPKAVFCGDSDKIRFLSSILFNYEPQLHGTLSLWTAFMNTGSRRSGFPGCMSAASRLE